MIAVIDVVGNNLTSLCNALTRIGAPYELTHSEKTIQLASHVILPGVGTAKEGMRALDACNLTDVLKQLTTPLLGICLGMQLMFESSAEGDIDCLGLLPGRVQSLSARVGFPVPHMGWNQLSWQQASRLRTGLVVDDFVYFVHGFAVQASAHTVATCDYSESFSAIVERNHHIGMQFHPEKSGSVGLQLLKNFVNEMPSC